MAYTVEQFIEKARQIHGDKYDYSKVEYINCKTKVCIICPIHGEFWQKPYAHLYGQDCPKCSHRSCRYTNEEWIEKAKQIHGDKYDYSKVNYLDAKTKVCIICRKHGEFWQYPNVHLKGCGCVKCFAEFNKDNVDTFIFKANKIHKYKYDYSKVKYVNSQTKVCIICHKHGEFWQRPCDHLNQKQGCPLCNLSHLENEIHDFLTENGIDFIAQYHCEWLKKLSLDFYIPSKNVAIECQGRQHFECEDYFGKREGFEKTWERDIRKQNLCKENNVKLLYYSNLRIDYPYEVIEDKEILLKKIIE